jgi:hypothetical protein
LKIVWKKVKVLILRETTQPAKRKGFPPQYCLWLYSQGRCSTCDWPSCPTCSATFASQEAKSFLFYRSKKMCGTDLLRMSKKRFLEAFSPHPPSALQHNVQLRDKTNVYQVQI